MIKIYSSRAREAELIDFLIVEFSLMRSFTNYPIKGITRKVRGTNLYQLSYPTKK